MTVVADGNMGIFKENSTGDKFFFTWSVNERSVEFRMAGSSPFDFELEIDGSEISEDGTTMEVLITDYPYILTFTKQ